MTLQDVHDDETAHEFVIYTDGSAAMTEKWPREAACAGWGLAIFLRSAAGLLTWCGSLSAPIYLGSTGTDVLGATRLTNNAAELTALLAALTWRATLPGQVRVRIVSDSKVSIDIVEQRARASTNVALVQQCRQVLKACRAFASTVMMYTNSHQCLLSNEIADALAKAAANGIARPEGAAHRCRELLSRWNGDHSPREDVQVVNLEAAFFWQEVSETQQRTNAPPGAGTRKVVGKARPAAFSLVPANVLTLHPADEQPDAWIGCNVSGRALDLQAVMHEWGADIVGIQEARDRHDSQRSGQHFEVFATAAAQGHGGGQLWIHKKPGTLANRLRGDKLVPSLRLDILVGHALVQDEQGKQELWWRKITALVQWRPQPGAELVALLDANGRVGSISSFAVGAVEPHEEDAGGEMLHDFLGKCDLMAANTFDGTGRRTWVPTRGQEAPIDYVVCLQRWLPMLHRARTADFSLAIADKEDHDQCLRNLFCVKRVADERKADRSSIMFDRARLRQAECREHLCQLIASAPPMPADISMDQHELLLTTFWKQCLKQACPRSQCVARNKWYSEHTWTHIVLARQERERFFWYGRHLVKLFLARGFGGRANVDVTVISAHLRDWALANRALARQDFEVFVIEKAERAETAAVRGDSRALYSIVKELGVRKRAGFKKVILEDGSVARDTKQEQRWWFRIPAGGGTAATEDSPRSPEKGPAVSTA